MSFINNLWYEKTLSSYLLQVPLLPFSSVFGMIAAARRYMYSSNLLKSTGPVVPVVVVGGITAGGSGKTPLCIALIRELKRRGFNPGILSRGYKASCTDLPCQVPLDGDPSVYGDEPCMMRNATRVPVVIDPQRTRGADYLVGLGVDVIVTDDGLQHYVLDRDVEICVLDGSRMLGNGHLLPAGPLREAKWRLKTVDTIVVTGAVAHLGYFPMILKPNGITPLNPESQEVLQSKSEVCALAGIGNPQRFFKTLEDSGFVIAKKVELGDHDKISIEKLKKLAAEMPVVMTSKDAVKYQSEKDNLTNIFVCKINASLSKQFFDDVVNKIKQSAYKVSQRRKKREEQGYTIEKHELIDVEKINQLNALDEAQGITDLENKNTLKTIINPDYEAQKARNEKYKEMKAQSIAKAYAMAEANASFERKVEAYIHADAHDLDYLSEINLAHQEYLAEKKLQVDFMSEHKTLSSTTSSTKSHAYASNHEVLDDLALANISLSLKSKKDGANQFQDDVNSDQIKDNPSAVAETNSDANSSLSKSSEVSAVSDKMQNNTQDFEIDETKERPLFGKRYKSTYDPHALPSELKKKKKDNS